MRLRRTRAAAAATEDDGTQNLASLEDHIRFDHVDELAVELANEAIRSRINEILQDGTFALIHLAAQGGKIEAMRVLIDAGADLNLHSANGQMPLDLAYQCNQQKASIFLLENGAKFTPNATTVDRYFNGDVWSSTKDTARTLLHWAARFGSLAAINAILLEDIPIDIQNDSGTTALHMACSFGQFEAAQLLLRRGASLQSRDYKGKGPLEKCKGGPDGPMATQLREILFPIHAALKRNDLTRLVELIRDETQRPQYDENGYSPFQCALLASDIAACLAIIFQTTESEKVDLWTLSPAQIQRFRKYFTTLTCHTPLSFVGRELAPLEACASQNNAMMIDWLLTLTLKIETLRDCSSPILSSQELDAAFNNAAQRHADAAMVKLAEYGANIFMQLPQFIHVYSTETLAQLGYGRQLPEELIRALKAASAVAPKLRNRIRRRAFLEFLIRSRLYTGRSAAVVVEEAVRGEEGVAVTGKISVQEQVFSLDLCTTLIMSFL